MIYPISIHCSEESCRSCRVQMYINYWPQFWNFYETSMQATILKILHFNGLMTDYYCSYSNLFGKVVQDQNTIILFEQSSRIIEDRQLRSSLIWIIVILWHSDPVNVLSLPCWFWIWIAKWFFLLTQYSSMDNIHIAALHFTLCNFCLKTFISIVLCILLLGILSIRFF